MHAASLKSSTHQNITTLSYDEYKSLGADTLLEIIRRSHLVLTNCPIASRNFDQAGLVRLGAMGKKITVHG